MSAVRARLVRCLLVLEYTASVYIEGGLLQLRSLGTTSAARKRSVVGRKRELQERSVMRIRWKPNWVLIGPWTTPCS